MTKVRRPRQPGPTRAYRIEGKDIFVFDGLFTRPEITQVDRECASLDYMRAWNAELNRGYTEWSVLLEPRTSRQHVVVQRIEARLAALYPSWRLSLQESYVKNLCYGDCPYPHIDGRSQRDRMLISAVYYANLRWDPVWGGETHFFNGDMDAVLSVSPSPGRLVIFDGTITHRAGAPMRNCQASRYSLINKFRGVPRAGHISDTSPFERSFIAL
jgi:Rps23 Pro-64 3,4-dihydroxylase Tpa1-like proline 4-hydroxylase